MENIVIQSLSFGSHGCCYCFSMATQRRQKKRMIDRKQLVCAVVCLLSVLIDIDKKNDEDSRSTRTNIGEKQRFPTEKILLRHFYFSHTLAKVRSVRGDGLKQQDSQRWHTV